jgi:D-serine deaminase-like pyridoxal phosphate-dependent protein
VNAHQTGPYQIDDTSEILSPGVVVFADLVEQNIARMIEIAGDAGRLRPHCKTHKMAEVTKLQLAQGITKHKCATIAEAEMLADAGVTDVFLAYNPVGPHVRRCAQFAKTYPNVRFSVTADHEKPLRTLSEACVAEGVTVGVFLDIDSGYHRTGIPINDEAARLYALLQELPGVAPYGLHLYDGQNHQADLVERKVAVDAVYKDACEFAERLAAKGLDVPCIVAGGTCSFPVFAEYGDPRIELSPGTTVFHDTGYGQAFPDLVFQPASLVLTRVISRCHDDRLTLDAGNKSVAADPPFGNRLHFPELPDAKELVHNEEHLVLGTELAVNYEPGDVLLAIPRHTCPTSALHKSVYVVRDGRLVGEWSVTARDRKLTI